MFDEESKFLNNRKREKRGIYHLISINISSIEFLSISEIETFEVFKL